MSRENFVRPLPGGAEQFMAAHALAVEALYWRIRFDTVLPGASLSAERLLDEVLDQARVSLSANERGAVLARVRERLSR